VTPLIVTRYTGVNCLGRGVGAWWAALRERRSGLAACDFEDVVLDTFIGRVAGVENVTLPERLAAFDCRNNRLAWLGLEQDGFRAAVLSACERHGPRRVAVIMGTSTSGMLTTERAYQHRDPGTGALPAGFRFAETQSTFSLAAFVRTALGLEGPAHVVSTACSSSAKVFASAARMIEAGFADAAVVGGADSLCLTTLYGFRALELLSSAPCRPYDAERTASRSARARLRCSSARARVRCSPAWARLRRVSHVDAASGRASARGSRWSGRSPRAGLRRRRSAT
jgi:3-oxoacyl-[acyl-carrier-protein] synthase-1